MTPTSLLFSLVALPTAQAPHVHGIAELRVALDLNQMMVELQVPGDSILGFERPPRSDEERAALAQARARLGTGQWFLPSANAGCRLLSAQVDAEGFEVDENHKHEHTDHEHEHADHKHEHADHKHEHADHKHEHADHEHEHADHKHDHKHDHGDHEHEHGGHAEFLVSLSYQCTTPEQLGSLDTALFALFPMIERINLTVLLPSGQYAEALIPGRSQWQVGGQ